MQNKSEDLLDKESCYHFWTNLIIQCANQIDLESKPKVKFKKQKNDI